MKKEYQNFFESFKQFRKLHYGSLIPDLSHTDCAILMMIRCMVYGFDPMTMDDFEEYRKNHNSDRLKVKVSQVSEKMHQNATAVSRSLKSLEERELIVRTLCNQDRRVTYVDITPKGEEVLKNADQIMDEFTNAIFEKMGDDNLSELTNYLNKLFIIARDEIEKRKQK